MLRFERASGRTYLRAPFPEYTILDLATMYDIMASGVAEPLDGELSFAVRNGENVNYILNGSDPEGKLFGLERRSFRVDLS